MDWFKIITVALTALGGGTISVLHASGADNHKTIAGQIAQAMVVAAGIASATHQALSSQSPSATAASSGA